MSDKKRLLVLTSTFPRWQGDREPPFVFELTKRLTQHFEVLVLAPHASGAMLTENMEGVGVHRFRYCFPAWQTLAYNGGIMANLQKQRWRYLLVPLFVLSELFSLVRLLRKHPVSVIHAHWLIPQGMVASLVRLFCAKPALVCTSHGSDLFGLPGGVFAWLKKQAIVHADRFTVVSEAMSIHAAGLAAARCAEVIPMGVDLTGKFIPPPAGYRSAGEILFVGRLVENKGLRHLVSALDEILQQHPQARLTIVGDGPEREQLEAMAERSGMGERIRFLGALENDALPALYGRAAVCVLPSLNEGLGLTLVEALGCECPVVASDLPAVRDVVIDGVTGLTCRPGDSGDIAQKVSFLLHHPERCAALGHAGRTHVVARYDWGVVVSRYRQLFEALIHRS